MSVPSPSHTIGQHISGIYETHVTVGDLDGVLQLPQKLKQAGVEPLGFHGEPVEEPVVIGWMPAVSLYFKDPDGHPLEFISMLEDTPNAKFGVAPYSRWVACNT